MGSLGLELINSGYTHTYLQREGVVEHLLQQTLEEGVGVGLLHPLEEEVGLVD